MEQKLSDGAGCVYILGIIGKEHLCKIGFTSLSVHERAKDYGKTYGLRFYVVHVISSENAKALEQRVHEQISWARYPYKGSKEIFEITPNKADQLVRSLEPSTSHELINRELQWLYLELLKKQAKKAKEVWRIVDTLHRKYDFSYDLDDLRLQLNEEQVHILKYHELLIKKIDLVKEKEPTEKIHKKKREIKKSSMKRWRRRYGFSIPIRNRKLIIYSISLITIFFIAIMLIL